MQIKPQLGFQTAFLSTSADIAFGGGAAGAGKTHVLLVEPLRHIQIPSFGATIFRRTTEQIRKEGSIWDKSMELYSLASAKPRQVTLDWRFPSNSSISFAGIEYEKDLINYQGSEIAFIGFDELTHFTEKQFFYLLSRNRSTCGIRPYVRGTCNPDPDSWVARMIEWYIDQETGFPMPERSGVIRFFMKDGENIVWGDTKQQVLDQVPHLIQNFSNEINLFDLVKSFTFIPGSVYENKELLLKDPQYLANLMAQDEETRMRLLEGNWKIRTDNLSLFNHMAVGDIFSNNVSTSAERYITCDAARFGRDFCVIMAWQGWEVVGIMVLKKSDVHDIIEGIESLRKRFGIQKSNTLIDQDGVGASTVSMGGYRGFSGGGSPRLVSQKKEIYKNLKTQCFYYLAQEKINIGNIKVNVNDENCIIDGVRSRKVKMGSRVIDVSELIKADLRAIKRKDVDKEGKIQINTKEEQKIILGRSPDFADTLMMRSWFDLSSNVIWM